ncbi:MAG: MBL fold metallo-hydrolase [Bdellovibrionales bacterium]|nr:MBL fold metallo-hydrolase [Bdellovibrionales bacterium]
MVNISFLKSGHCFHPEFVSKKGGSFQSVMFPATVALIEHPRYGVLLFDTGYSEHFFTATKKFPEKLYRMVTPVELNQTEILRNQLKERGIGVKDVKNIFLSHFHGDHIGGVKDYPDAQFIYDHASYDSLKNLSNFSALRRAFLPQLLPSNFIERSLPVHSAQMSACAEVEGFLTGYDMFGDQSVVAVYLPGHEIGHMGLIVRANDQKTYLLAADAAYHRDAYLKGCLPHPLARIIIQDYDAYKTTNDKLSHLSVARPEITIIPCHCMDTFTDIRSEVVK